MPNPNYNQQLNEIWGWPDEVAGGLWAGASNIVVGTNPSYAIDDLAVFFPNLTGTNPPNNDGAVPTPVLNAFIALASASLVQARWEDSWYYAMALFVAHYCTLWLQQSGTQPANNRQLAAQGIAKGILIAKSVDGVSGSYKTIEGLEDFGSFGLTSYGQLLITMAKGMGAGGMLLY